MRFNPKDGLENGNVVDLTFGTTKPQGDRCTFFDCDFHTKSYECLTEEQNCEGESAGRRGGAKRQSGQGTATVVLSGPFIYGSE